LIRVSIFYPYQPGQRFDADYYLNTHMPLACRLLAPAIKAVSVDIGLSGRTPDAPPQFAAVCQFTCDSVDAFAAAIAPHATELQNDVLNYTDIQPVVQFSEIRMAIEIR
jgi:uncharacterized protein (TIGR02118 family)